MGDSLSTVVLVFLTGILMFVTPLVTISERRDQMAQLNVQSIATQYIDKVRTTGNMSKNDYSNMIEEISKTGNAYDVDMTVQILDDNPGVKTTQAEMTKIGENIYYNMYTTQVEDEIYGSKECMQLKEGDIVSITVKNTNKTIAQLLKNFLFQVDNAGTYKIAAQYAGVILVNGATLE